MTKPQCLRLSHYGVEGGSHVVLRRMATVVEREFHVRPIGEGWFAWECKNASDTHCDRYGMVDDVPMRVHVYGPETAVFGGICDARGVEQLIELGQTPDTPTFTFSARPGDTYSYDAPMEVWTSDHIEQARLWGYPLSRDGLRKYYDPIKKPLDGFSAGELTLDNLVFNCHQDHTVRDRKGRLLPVAVYFGPGSGYVDDQHYNMKSVIEILSARDDVVRLANNSWDPHPDGWKNVWGDLRFIWRPTVEAYRRAARVKRHFSWVGEGVIKLDLLGIKKAKHKRIRSDYK